MRHGIMARLVLTLALIAVVTPQASALDLWDTAFGWLGDKCNGGYTCYGPPYGNTEPPDLYVYDHRRGPTWTGNGWAYLPVGRYRPRPPGYAERRSLRRRPPIATTMMPRTKIARSTATGR